MQFCVITIFPEMFTAVSDCGVVGRALNDQLLSLDVMNLREYGHGSHRMVDDRPFGGGPGMVMMAEPIVRCVADAKKKLPGQVPVIYPSPQGKRLEHADMLRMSSLEGMIIICGRYEGIDQRALDIIEAEEWSIGDYVLSGGELPAMVLIDAIARLLPGVLGNESSSGEDSFANGLLDTVHYTRPYEFEEHAVPEVLMSGHHEEIRRWRLKQSVGRTWLHRPDILEKLPMNDEQKQVLEEFQREYKDLENQK